MKTFSRASLMIDFDLLNAWSTGKNRHHKVLNSAGLPNLRYVCNSLIISTGSVLLETSPKITAMRCCYSSSIGNTVILSVSPNLHFPFISPAAVFENKIQYLFHRNGLSLLWKYITDLLDLSVNDISCSQNCSQLSSLWEF